MKKTRLLAFLITVCLTTTCLLTGTVAKYSTSDAVADQGTVAKWGIQLEMTGHLFTTSYSNTINQEEKVTVQSASNPLANLLAPGTSGGDMNISLSGTAEVATSVDVVTETQDIYLAAGTYAIMAKAGKLTVAEYNAYNNASIKLYTYNSTYSVSNAWNANDEYYVPTHYVTVDSNGYYPVKYSSGIANDNTEYTAATLANKITTDLDKDFYAVGNNFNTEYNITWEWDFQDSVENNRPATDAKDTILGTLIASGASNTTVVSIDTSNNNAATILTVDPTNNKVKNGETEVGSIATKFDVTITVTQVD